MLPTPRAIVLGSYETGLGVVRSLGRCGIPVHVIDHQRLHAARSRYASFSLCPNPTLDPKAFLDHVVTVAQRDESGPPLFLTADEFLLPVAHDRHRLGEHVRLNIPDTPLLESIVDKGAQSRLAAAAGVPLPVTVVVESEDDIAQAAEVPLPAFVKGRNAVEWRRAFGGTQKGIVVRSKAELRETLSRLLARGAVPLVQEIIPGGASQHFKVSAYISLSGRMLAAFVLRKLRQHPHGFGFGCAVETVSSPEVLELGMHFFEAIGYRGVGSAEFKFDPRDGHFKLIELNPRYWQQNVLAEQCGMNIPLLEFQDLCGVEMPPVGSYRTGVKWVNIHRDFETARDLRRRGELTVAAWLSSLRGEKCWSDFSLDDPRPGVWALGRELRGLLGGMARRLTRRGRRGRA